ncbi:hypothetical protein V1291_000009 [Nitrobacteraceae bacterium AZCC 1564]
MDKAVLAAFFFMGGAFGALLTWAWLYDERKAATTEPTEYGGNPL